MQEQEPEHLSRHAWRVHALGWRKRGTSREHLLQLLPVKWRSLAGSTASFQGGPKGRPPPGPPPAINLSLFHPPGVGAPAHRCGSEMPPTRDSPREREASFVVRVQYGVGLRPSFYIGSLGGASPTQSTDMR